MHFGETGYQIFAGCRRRASRPRARSRSQPARSARCVRRARRRFAVHHTLAIHRDHVDVLEDLTVCASATGDHPISATASRPMTRFTRHLQKDSIFSQTALRSTAMALIEPGKKVPAFALERSRQENAPGSMKYAGRPIISISIRRTARRAALKRHPFAMTFTSSSRSRKRRCSASAFSTRRARRASRRSSDVSFCRCSPTKTTRWPRSTACGGGERRSLYGHKFMGNVRTGRYLIDRDGKVARRWTTSKSTGTRTRCYQVR